MCILEICQQHCQHPLGYAVQNDSKQRMALKWWRGKALTHLAWAWESFRAAGRRPSPQSAGCLQSRARAQTPSSHGWSPPSSPSSAVVLCGPAQALLGPCTAQTERAYGLMDHRHMSDIIDMLWLKRAGKWQSCCVTQSCVILVSMLWLKAVEKSWEIEKNEEKKPTSYFQHN